jgi:hypothetical protein
MAAMMHAPFRMASGALRHLLRVIHPEKHNEHLQPGSVSRNIFTPSLKERIEISLNPGRISLPRAARRFVLI